jgi:uncharacterized protein YndB with AHSA1/START domain
MTTDSNGFRLHLENEMPAAPERVFEALTDPERLKQWWGPNGFTTPQIDLDLRVGGAYRFTMQPPEGERFHLRGEFREIEPPKRIAYTFEWEEPAPGDVETLAVLTLRDLGGSTELVLDQGEFTTEERLELHRGGWSEALEKLRQAL